MNHLALALLALSLAACGEAAPNANLGEGATATHSATKGIQPTHTTAAEPTALAEPTDSELIATDTLSILERWEASDLPERQPWPAANERMSQHPAVTAGIAGASAKGDLVNLSIIGGDDEASAHHLAENLVQELHAEEPSFHTEYDLVAVVKCCGGWTHIGEWPRDADGFTWTGRAP